MAETLSALEKAKAREVKRLKELEVNEERVRDERGRIRKLEKELKTRRAFLLGESLLAVELSDVEKSVLAGILSRRPDRPRNWREIDDLTGPLPDFVPSRPVFQRDAALLENPTFNDSIEDEAAE